MSDIRAQDEVRAEQIAQFKHYVRFVSRDPEKNRHRFYLLSWQISLQDDTVLVCTWGRLGIHGRSRILLLTNALTETYLERLIRRRLQRGYRVCEWS